MVVMGTKIVNTMVVEVVTREEEMVVDIVEVEDVRVRDTEVQVVVVRDT